MRSTTSSQTGLVHSRHSPRAALVTSWPRALTARIATWRVHARESQELLQMSDRELQDIGLTRLDAEAFARGRF
jgi:uncharacterized protein YjiS (DUF1127 family)